MKFLAYLGGSQEVLFIGKRQEHFRDTKILRDLMRGDRVEDPIIWTIRGSPYLYRISTLI